MKLYTSDGCSYEGMAQEVIISLRGELGRDTLFVTEEEYEIYLSSIPK